jgi:hypothetical protein
MPVDESAIDLMVALPAGAAPRAATRTGSRFVPSADRDAVLDRVNVETLGQRLPGVILHDEAGGVRFVDRPWRRETGRPRWRAPVLGKRATRSP